ncbi:MAG TPA: fibronectin type III domain-containing protein, partial [Candidatus Angelobacter sp.]|nr:fibronectin type III domain-containing protein [Candidatus Angelobacter sp.]
LNAVAGNASALVSWSAPAQIGGAPITSYTVTVIRQSIRTNTTFTVLAPDTTAVITGLTNGTNYSFSVHATNAGGNGMESTPSNLVTPAATPGAITVSVTGPSIPALQFLPANLTFAVNVTNNTPNAVSAGSILATLTQAAPDGAFIFFAQPTQGSCSAGGNGVLSVTCPLGTIAALTTATINVTATIQSNVATLDATFTGLDINSNPVNSFGTFTLTPPAPPAPATDIQITGSAQNGGPTVTGTLPTGAPDTYTWQVKNAQNVIAPNVKFSNTMPGSLRFDSVTLNPAAVGTCTAPAVGALGGTIACTIPSMGGAAQFNVVVNVHVVQTGTIQNKASVAYAGDTNNANNAVTVTINAK